jgi:hypothetical protein
VGGHKTISISNYPVLVAPTPPPPIRYWVKTAAPMNPGNADDFAPKTFDFSYCLWLQAVISPTPYFVGLYTPTPYKTFWIDLWCTSDENYGKIRVRMQIAAGASLDIFGFASLLDGLPHFIVVTCDRDSVTGLKLYVDNVLNATADPTPFVAVDFSPVNPLRAALSATEEDARLDQFRFYKNTILTPEQIAAIYACGKGVKVSEDDFTALTSAGFYVELDEGIGNPIGRLLTAGVWTNSLMTGDAPYWFIGGVPFP